MLDDKHIIFGSDLNPCLYVLMKSQIKIIVPPKSYTLAGAIRAAKRARQPINTAIFLGILLVLIANLFATSRPRTTIWEYTIASIDDIVLNQEMQRLGAEGWELASSRRAVSGEGESSKGLYELIFKRPITKAQARENAKKLEAEVENSKLRSKQSLAKFSVGSINREQQANYVEKNTFIATIEELGLDYLKSETEDYTYSLATDSIKSFVTATAKTDGLKSYAGGVFAVQENGVTTTVAVTCETDSPSKTPLGAPQLNGNEPACPVGSSKVD